MTVPTGESIQPQETAAHQKVHENKGVSFSEKFQKTKIRFARIDAGIKKTFSKTIKAAPQIVFDAEQHELDRLSGKLTALTQETAMKLEIPPAESPPDEQTPTTNREKEESTSAGNKLNISEILEIAKANKDTSELSQYIKSLQQMMGGEPAKDGPPEQQEEEQPDVTAKEITPREALLEGIKRPTQHRQEHNTAAAPAERRPGTRRPVEVIQQLKETGAAEQLENMFAEEGMLGDSDKIEGHQIDFIQQGDKIVVAFKMTSHMVEKVTGEVIPNMPSEQAIEGTYTFQSANGQTADFGDCWMIKVDENTTLYVAKGTKAYEQVDVDLDKPIQDDQGNLVGYEKKVSKGNPEPVRALIGAVKIEVQGVTDPQQVADKVAAAYQRLTITDALTTPDATAEESYKEARFRWQHKLGDQQMYDEYARQFKEENGRELRDHLVREEVFPGYYTIVDQGASDVYQKDGRIFLTHSVYDPNHLVPILTHGLLSSHERFKRGVFTTGMSTQIDFGTGGADSVFIRAVTENAGGDNVKFNQPHLLINPQVLDRTDWYAYNYDEFGTTQPDTFDVRPSPESFFAAQRQALNTNNEIMMRRGIPPAMISGIAVGSEEQQAKIIDNLQAAGIHEVNGVSLKDFVVVRRTLGDLKAGKPPATG